MKKLISVLLLIMMCTLYISADFIGNSKSSVTITLDTTATVFYGLLTMTNFGGGFHANVLPDCTSQGSSTFVTDTLRVSFKMLSYDGAGTYTIMHNDWRTTEMYSGTAWVSTFDWTDGNKYTIDFSDLDACDACSLKVDIGTGYEPIGTVSFEAIYFKR